MFNLSFGELIVLGALGLIFIGPKQLPQLARILGKTLAELKKAMNDVKTSVTTDLMEDKKLEAVKPIPDADQQKITQNDLDKPGT